MCVAVTVLVCGIRNGHGNYLTRRKRGLRRMALGRRVPVDSVEEKGVIWVSFSLFRVSSFD